MYSSHCRSYQSCKSKDFHQAPWVFCFRNQCSWAIAKPITNTIKVLHTIGKASWLQSLCDKLQVYIKNPWMLCQLILQTLNTGVAISQPFWQGFIRISLPPPNQSICNRFLCCFSSITAMVHQFQKPRPSHFGFRSDESFMRPLFYSHFNIFGLLALPKIRLVFSQPNKAVKKLNWHEVFCYRRENNTL